MEYRTEGLGPIVANFFKSGLQYVPPYCFISILNRELMCPDGTGTTTMMVPTDGGGHIPATYGAFVEASNKDTAQTPPPHRLTDRANDFEPGYNLVYGPIYNVSEI